MFINYAIPVLVLGAILMIVFILLLTLGKHNTKKDIILRFLLVVTIILIIFLLVITRIFYLHTSLEGDKLRELGDKKLATNIDTVNAKRGNILSDDNKMLASSIPTYYVYMDMRVEALRYNKERRREKRTKSEEINDPENFFNKNIDSLAFMLSSKFGDKPASQYKKDLSREFKAQNPKYKLFPKPIKYTDFLELKKFPILRRGKIQGGLITEERMTRTKPFGPLASRTIGQIYGITEKGGSCGLELEYDDYLKGEKGLVTRRKVAGRYTTIELKHPEDGCDIKSTINIDIQEIAYSSLRDMLVKHNCRSGCAILMETKTGHIKAISNLEKVGDGRYEEVSNIALSSQIEPGSTFKTLSALIAIEDHYIDTTTKVDTKNGVITFSDRAMKDWNYKSDGSGGFGIASLPVIMQNSSNTGISYLINQHYASDPMKFINGIIRTGIADSIHLEIPGHGKVKLKYPGEKNWYRTTLPWMSIGYEVQVPPIYTLMFYNAIANNGKMVKPMFVTEILKKGKTLKTFRTEVVKDKICSKNTLRQLQDMLLSVVEVGTAKPAKSSLFKVAGKTGTAQVVGDDGRYSGHGLHQITFVGYFPADEPQYTCLVYIKTAGLASAGGMCGTIFKNIAERAYMINGNAIEIPEEEQVCDIRLRDIIHEEAEAVERESAEIRDKN